MMQLIITACLLSEPAVCRDERLDLTLNGVDAGQCMYSSMPRIARWQVMHRKWRVKSWKCALITDDRNA